MIFAAPSATKRLPAGADTQRVGYGAPDRLWKLKDVPSIDYMLCALPGHGDVYELMLRGGEGVMQNRATADAAVRRQSQRLPSAA